MSADTIRIAILGTGSMAAAHARAFQGIEGVEVVAGIDLHADRLNAFCKTHNIDKAFSDLGEALAWVQFDAIANVTPDQAHHSTTLKALAAGKHVFCEKPLATNHADALEMAAAAEKAGLIGMVNLSYRNVNAVQKAREMVLGGEIGAVRHVEASYLQSWLSSAYWGDWRTEDRWLWRLSTRHGSNGVLGDVGIHILDFASFGVGSEIADADCRMKAFAKAENDRIGEYNLDANDSFVMAVTFENGALGTIHASRWASGYSDDLSLRIFGSKGGLEVSYGGKDINGQRIARLRACTGDNLLTHQWREVPLGPVPTNYELFVQAIREGRTIEPSFGHAAHLQKFLSQEPERLAQSA